MHLWKLAASTALIVALPSCQTMEPAPESEVVAGAATDVGTVDSSDLLSAAGNNANWLTYGRDYSEQRYSPLGQINRANVGELGLAWYADMDTARGQEATPLVIDGMIYVSTAWSKVKAYDARTGALAWEYDPQVPGQTAVNACCDVVNRGLAAWGEHLFLGTLDGRLVALDRATGEEVWSTVTVDQSKPYTITGAPRVIDGKVIIGNGGAEYGVRGYVSAYDAADGEMLWRFYTVPGDPSEAGSEPQHLQDARETWNGEFWDLGGGGTVWDAMAFDAELDLLYIGVGNGSPWNQAYRSPGGGDNLYLSSIVALRPSTGEYVWHYQTTPGETWDFTATQHIMLADIEIDGRERQVLMQAPKNGFFYVLDRATGELIDADPYTTVNWATGVDPATGRPIEVPAARYDRTGQPFFSQPGAGGAHNWHPMAFHPGEGLVYIPVIDAAFPYFPESNWEPDRARGFNVGIDQSGGAMPPIVEVREQLAGSVKGALVAWDPATNSQRWRVEFPGPWNGGLLATGGGLVFQGLASGNMAAFDAADGTELWRYPVQTGVVAPPITYELDGEQYVAVMAGWGGIWALAPGGILNETSGPVPNISRLLVFRLGGTAQLPPAPPLIRRPIDPPALTVSAEEAAAGSYNFARYCSGCHGDAAIGSTVLPDLRRSATLGSEQVWQQIVHDGVLQSRGMVGFQPSLTREEIEGLRQYVIHRAQQDRALGGRGS